MRASAPGKLVLLGEYAVLFGHPAAVLAIDRRARVELVSSADSRFGVHAPGVAASPVRFELADDGSFFWHPPGADGLPLVEAVLGAMVDEGLIEPEQVAPFDTILDTREFLDSATGSGIKLGLGSSAALTVALASAVCLWAGRSDAMDPSIGWLDRLLRIHREFQGGRGSGIDLAASLFGGALEYRLTEGGGASAEPISLPGELEMACVWTCRSADTGVFLESLAEVMEKDRAPADRAIHHIGDVARHGIAALRRNRTDNFLEAVDASCGAMEGLGTVTGLQIVSDVHLELRDLVRRCGAHYKPSGAGGGDMGLIFAAGAASLSAAVGAARTAGFVVIDAELDPDGLQTAL